MAENSVIISAEEEAKLLKPIDEYVEKIQKKIDALRVDGSDKVNDLKNQIAIAKENKNLSKAQRDKIIENSKKELENAKKVEADNKEEIKKLSEDNKDVLEALGKALEGKVKKVELTSRLKSHPCCLRAEGPVTLEMEKVLNQQAAVNGGETVRADRILELNADHPIFKKLCALQAEGSDALADDAAGLAAVAQGEAVAPRLPRAAHGELGAARAAHRQVCHLDRLLERALAQGGWQPDLGDDR